MAYSFSRVAAGQKIQASHIDDIQAAIEVISKDKINILSYIPEAEHGAIRAYTSTYDCSAAISSAMAAGKRIFFPAGNYRIYSSIIASFFGLILEGEHSTRPDLAGGSILQFYGTGPCIQLGTDNGHVYDAADYDGTGAFAQFRNISIAYKGSSNTNLLNGQGAYGTGTYGIKDWRGGELVFENVWLENFEWGFWGIQSDINSYDRLHLQRCHVGMYLGPRSDQPSIKELYTLYNDTDVWLDRITVARFRDCQFVGGGSSTTPQIKIGSQWSIGCQDIFFDGCWFEHYQGDAVIPSFIDIGMGDSVQSTGIWLENSGIWTNPQGGASPYAQYFIRADNLDTFYLGRYKGTTYNLANLLYFTSPVARTQTGFLLDTAAQTPTHTIAGSADPRLARITQTGGNIFLDSRNNRIYIRSNPVNTNQRFYLGSDAAYTVNMVFDGHPTNTQFYTRSRREVEGTAAPTSGTWQVGDRVWNTAPTAGGTLGWVCVTAGTPGTWKTFGSIAP